MNTRIHTALTQITRLAAATTITLAAGVLALGSPASASASASAIALTTQGRTASTPGTDPAGNDGSAASFQATTPGLTGHYIRHSSFDGVIAPVTKLSSGTDRGDATWIVRAGLADSLCVSLESRNFPGRYLRHSSMHLVLQNPDGTKIFREDATFCLHQGKNGTGISLASFNYPDRYIRHYQRILYIASNGGPNPFDIGLQWANDVSWRIAQPWAP